MKKHYIEKPRRKYNKKTKKCLLQSGVIMVLSLISLSLNDEFVFFNWQLK